MIITRQRELQTNLSRFVMRAEARDRGLYVSTVIDPLGVFVRGNSPTGHDDDDFEKMLNGLAGEAVDRLASERSRRVNRLAMRTVQATAIGELWQLSKLQPHRELVVELTKADEKAADAAVRKWLETATKAVGVTTRMMDPATSARVLREIVSKTVLTSAQFDQLTAVMRSQAFRVWTLNDLGLVQSIRDSITTSLTNGRGFRSFYNELTQTLAEAGKPELPFWHASTVYQNNVAAAYSDAKNAVINTPTARRVFPLRRYMTRNNVRVRPTHKALHGLVFKTTDPFWNSHDPPWEHNCRCYAETVTQKEADRRGYRVATLKDARKRGVEPAKNFARTGSTLDAGGLDDDLRKQLDAEIKKREGQL